MRPEDINFLVGCEESQAVVQELVALGVNAYSCDLKKTSGPYPERHIHGDVFKAIKSPEEDWFLETQTGAAMYVDKWHAAVFHPECTYLAASGLHWNARTPERKEKTEEALLFVRDLLNCGIPFTRLENPVGCISTRIYYDPYTGRYEVSPKEIKGLAASQIIQPFMFGDDASKATCLWNRGLPNIRPKYKDFCPPRMVGGSPRWGNQADSGQNKLSESPIRAELRSKTYPGIAKAIAQQTVEYLLKKL